jgi:O-antigen/teichoic acid export membrane protein
LSLARITAVDLICQIAGLIAMVGMARLYPSIWALVFGTIIVGPLRIALSHWAMPGPPNRWRLDREYAREILGYGKWIVLSSLLSFAVVSGDRIVLGGLTDASTLGQYALAIMIVNAIQQLINAIIGNVALPALSEVHRNRPAQLRQAFYRLRVPVDVAALVLAGFLFEAGSRITGLLYDERYQLAGPALEILSLSLFAVRYEIATQCYLALGKSKLIVPPMAARLLPLFILTPVAFRFGGFQAAVWVIALVPLAGVPLHLYLMRRLGILDLRRELAVLPCLAIGLLAGRALPA